MTPIMEKLLEENARAWGLFQKERDARVAQFQRLEALLAVLDAEDDGTYSGDLRTAICAARLTDKAAGGLE